MKKYIATLLLFFAVFSVLKAQDKGTPQLNKPLQHTDSVHLEHDKLPVDGIKVDTAKIHVPNIYAWKINPRLGERTFLPRDTVLQNFHQSMLVDGQGVAIGYLGNIGSPAVSKLFFEIPDASRFNFLDAMSFWRKNPGDQYFLNTKIPYSNIKYQNGGAGASAESRFQGEMSMNVNKKLNIGFDIDYVYSRGYYSDLSNKQINYDFYTSYIGSKYKMHGFFSNNNFTNVENGGILNPIYITNPNAEVIRTIFSGNTLDIPVRLQNTTNKLRGRNIYVTNRYDLGNDKEEYAVNDTTMGWRIKENYTPLASAIFTTHYTDQQRRIKSSFANMDNLYPYYDGIDGTTVDNPKYQGSMNDFMSYYSFKNTFALAMNEGFRKWTKFGLTAFAEYDKREYSIPGELPGLRDHRSEDALTIGGVLSKEKGKYLRYKASAETDIINADYKALGEITTMLKFRGKNFSVKANGYIKSTSPDFFVKNFSTKYWNWTDEQTNFDHINRIFLGGEINFPELSFSKTKISGGVETIKNYIYYGANNLPQQYSGDVQVVSLRLDQNLRSGIFHWDNQIVYQTTTNDKVIPLPDLSVYTNIYLMTKVAKVLTLQLGVDAHYHTKYYLPGYEPLTMQFYNQRDTRLGNYPVATVYANLHLKYTRFFVMMYNVADGMISDQSSFSLYRYPVDPRILKLGLSWQFNN